MSCLLLATVLWLPPAPAAPPAGLVLTVTGNVVLARGPGPGRPVAAAELLRAGDSLRAAAEGEARIVFFHDGHRERLKPGARATVGATGCTPAEAVEPLPGKKPSAANLESLRGLARSERAAVRVAYMRMLKSPLEGSRVVTLTPRFSWMQAARGASYQVELRTGDGKTTLWKATTQQWILLYPEQQKPLEYGRSYRWLVTTRLPAGGTKQVASGRFQVVTKAEAEQLALVRPLAKSDDLRHLLVAAATYDAYGAYDEAMSLFDRLAHSCPDEAHFQRVLAAYHERAGDKVAAQRARERAKQLGATVPTN
jgi:hypothetical protein